MMRRARPAIIAAIGLIGVCGLSLLLFIALDTFLHVKIPYAVVSSFFLTAVLMFWTIRIAFRRGELPAGAPRNSRTPEFPGESRTGAPDVPLNSVAMRVIAPFDGVGTEGGSAAQLKVAPRVSLRCVILFNSSVGDPGREAV